MKKTLYDILEVSPNASPETIKAAYKSLVQKYHPDKNPGIPDADKLLKLINHAYEILSNPVRRAAYDAELGREGVHGPDSHNVEMGEGNNRANGSGGNNGSDGHEHNTPNQEEKWSRYAAMIGQNTVYYLKHFRRFDRISGTRLTWHWPAFFTGGFIWALYRKMYKVAFLLLGVTFVSLLLVEAIFSSEVVSNVTILAMYVGFAMNANAIYYRYLKNQIEELSSRLSASTLLNTLQEEGGVNRWIRNVLFGVIPIPVLGILAAIAMPAYQDYVIRLQVQKGLALADPAVTCVTRSYQTSKTVPPDTAACGLPTHIANELVDGVDIGDNGVVTITFSSNRLKNATLLFTPYVEENGGIAWTCSEGGTLPTIYRPVKCRT